MHFLGKITSLQTKNYTPLKQNKFPKKLKKLEFLKI